MGKIDQVTRDKAIDLLASYRAEGYRDYGRRDIEEEMKDILKNGHKGLVDYTDEELFGEFKNYFEDYEQDHKDLRLNALQALLSCRNDPVDMAMIQTSIDARRAELSALLTAQPLSEEQQLLKEMEMQIAIDNKIQE